MHTRLREDLVLMLKLVSCLKYTGKDTGTSFSEFSFNDAFSHGLFRQLQLSSWSFEDRIVQRIAITCIAKEKNQYICFRPGSNRRPSVC
jgi:hypothetical protein